eukprot:8076359-Karenia_brevis.AAC.1
MVKGHGRHGEHNATARVLAPFAIERGLPELMMPMQRARSFRSEAYHMRYHQSSRSNHAGDSSD